MTTTTTASAVRDGSANWIRILCWTTVTLEGFDVVALGAAIPSILQSKYLEMGPAEATFVTTISLVGILVGALTVGPISDRYGRKISIIGSVAIFSVLTLLVPLAPSVAVFGTLRFLAGVGLGACLPPALTMMSEITAESGRARGTTLTMTGYHTGAVLTSLLALLVAPNWQILFVTGGVVGLLAIPVMWLKLPETNQVALERREKPEKAPRAVPLSAVLRPPFLLASIATWVASFMGLLLVYGLNSWLPTIMREAGYELSASLTLLLLLNVGGVLGLLLAGVVGDARGIRSSAIGWFVGAAVLLALLSVRMPTLLLDLAVLLTGVFVFSAQVLIYSWISRAYPSEVRGTAMGAASGLGRIGSIVGPTITGALVTAGIAYPWGFYFFAVVAALAVVALVLVPRNLEHAEHDTPAPSRVSA